MNMFKKWEQLAGDVVLSSKPHKVRRTDVTLSTDHSQNYIESFFWSLMKRSAISCQLEFGIHEAMNKPG
jgi:hypothetical protein